MTDEIAAIRTNQAIRRAQSRVITEEGYDIDTLLTHLARVEQDNRVHLQTIDNISAQLQVAKELHAQVQQALTTQTEALKKYGSHHMVCTVHLRGGAGYTATPLRLPCSCGFDAALAPEATKG